MTESGANRRVTRTTNERVQNRVRGIEVANLGSHERHRRVESKVKVPGEAIDLGSAACMNIYPLSITLPLNDAEIREAAETMVYYPALLERVGDLETSISHFFDNQLGIPVDPNRIGIYNGVYGSYRSILSADTQPNIIVPDMMYVNHRAAFESMGKHLVDTQVQPNGLLDIDNLQQQLRENRGTVGYVYINHNRGPAPDRDYFRDLGKTFQNEGVIGLYDDDVLFTRHGNTATVEPLDIPEFSNNTILLGNFSKEFGAPGLRIGFAIGPSAEAMKSQIRFRELTLEMIPNQGYTIANYLISRANVPAIQKEYRARMKNLCDGLEELGWPQHLPSTGINHFAPVPESFTAADNIGPGELFSYHLLKTAGVRVRPGSHHGANYANEIRFVIAQPSDKVKDAMVLLKAKGISFDMQMPPRLEEEYLSLAS